MLRLSTVFVRDIPIGLTLVVLVLAEGITRLQATPVCTTTIVLPTGSGNVPSSMLDAGVCVQAQDKLFGDFNFGNVPSSFSVNFGFLAVEGNERHSITLTAPFTPGNSYTNSFEVEALGGAFISQMSADITQTVGGPTTLVQTTSVTPNSGSIDFSKSDNIVSDPFQVFFTPAQNVTDMVVTGTLTTGPNSDASAILDTIVEPCR